jgi:site-specific DNA-methyltransferase (adenine-specific)
MPDKSVDLTVTSPPYDNLRTYNNDIDKTWCADVWKPIIAELKRVTNDGGVVVWVVNDATINGSETGTSFKQALWAMECGFRLHDTMIWNKGGFTSPESNRYPQTWEYMFIFSSGKPSSFCGIKDRKNTGKPFAYASHSKICADGTRKKMHNSKRELDVPMFGIRFSTWDTPHERNPRGHPAPFPVRLAKDHIISWSNEGDTVLDPFMGSGTTGVACMETGRKFIGIELYAGYYDIAAKRIHEATRQQRLF